LKEGKNGYGEIERGEKELWNTIRQLPDPTMALQVIGNCLVWIRGGAEDS